MIIDFRVNYPPLKQVGFCSAFKNTDQGPYRAKKIYTLGTESILLLIPWVSYNGIDFT